MVTEVGALALSLWWLEALWNQRTSCTCPSQSPLNSILYQKVKVSTHLYSYIHSVWGKVLLFCCWDYRLLTDSVHIHWLMYRCVRVSHKASLCILLCTLTIIGTSSSTGKTFSSSFVKLSCDSCTIECFSLRSKASSQSSPAHTTINNSMAMAMYFNHLLCCSMSYGRKFECTNCTFYAGD